MKKIVVFFAALSLLCAPAQAQGILGRIAGSAGKAVGNVVGKTVNDKVSEKVGDLVPEEAKGLAEMGQITPATGEQAVPPRRYSTFGWDGPVTPSDAQFPLPLINELPAVPSAADLVNPVEEKQIAYYKAIKRVTLRAEELNAETTCEDQETLLWREKTNKMLRDSFGLTDADIALLEKENPTEAEQQYISEKVSKALLGDLDVEQLEREAAEMEGKSQTEILNETFTKTELAVFAVYDAHAAELKKYTDYTAQEYKDAYHLNMKDEKAGAARNKEMEAHMKQFQKSKDSAFQKEAAAFQKTITKELTSASLGATGTLGAATAAMNTMQKLSPIMEMEQKLAKYYSDITAAFPKQTRAADEAFSAAERQKVLKLKTQIYSTKDANVYNPLYLEALELIRTYRERAAKAWVADIQKRFDAVKGAVANVTKINRQAIADELIPECALYRIPLNMVIDAGDILAEAYSEFPADYPKMYQEEPYIHVGPGSTGFGRDAKYHIQYEHGMSFWFPEFTVWGPAQYDAVLNGDMIYAVDGNGKVYRHTGALGGGNAGGGWAPVSDAEVKKLTDSKAEYAPASQSWTSSDGKRTVYYNAEGGFIQLPEGDQAFPMCWKKVGNELKWIHMASQETGNGEFEFMLVECTYKL